MKCSAWKLIHSIPVLDLFRNSCVLAIYSLFFSWLNATERASESRTHTHAFHQALVDLQQDAATRAKEQINLKTDFGWAKFKKQQKNDTRVWVNKRAIFSFSARTFQIFESTESQGVILDSTVCLWYRYEFLAASRTHHWNSSKLPSSSLSAELNVLQCEPTERLAEV